MGAWSRSDNAKSSDTASRQPLPAKIAMDFALSINRAAATISASAGATSGRTRSVAMLRSLFGALAANTSAEG